MSTTVKVRIKSLIHWGMSNTILGHSNIKIGEIYDAEPQHIDLSELGPNDDPITDWVMVKGYNIHPDDYELILQ